VLVITPLLHIGMDFTNNYGVHPFWPLVDRWFYGDAVFIAEPLLWAACAPLAFTFRSKLARFIVAAVLAIGIGLALLTALVPLAPAIVLIALIAAMLLLGWRAQQSVALVGGVALWLGVTAMFAVSSQVAARRVETLAATTFPDARSIDHVLTPMPSNPLCWEVMLVHDARARTFADSGRELPEPQPGSSEHCAPRACSSQRQRGAALVRRSRDGSRSAQVSRCSGL
jgi:inner membrane protein